MRLLFDSRYVENICIAIERNAISNNYIAHAAFFTTFAYAFGVLNWFGFTVCLAIMLSMHIFLNKDIGRQIKEYRKQYYLWEKKHEI